MDFIEIIVSAFVGIILGHVINTSIKIKNFLRKIWFSLFNKQTGWSITARFEKEDGTDFDYSVFENVKNYFINPLSAHLTHLG